ncbi:MAG: CtsR family transcriptional regulator [Clostridia bacterium]|nr:CtsR family transcriptional regulator [Clostridia bacterium]
MRISDSVANYIMEMLNEADGIAEIQRNELANILGCVPSQINYVITSRFTPEQGYIVESRRGGGGYIRIIRRRMTKSDMIMHVVNAVGPSLDAASARAMLRNLLETGVTSESDAALMAAALSEKSLAAAPKETRDQIRAAVFKNMLLVLNT